MAYITNGGARLIDRARTEGKSIVFGSVRMNTIYKSDPSSLVQKSVEWYGANHGEVVGCLSHVSVDDVSCVCDSKLAVQCNDNSESWKSIGIYAHLDGEESGEILFACESIQNGEYKDVTIVELPVTLDGVVEDFGLSEGGSGGGNVPVNMMTTDTDQGGLTGSKTWVWENYKGDGTVEDPQEGDILVHETICIDSFDCTDYYPRGCRLPIALESIKSTWFPGEGWHHEDVRCLRITLDGVTLDNSSTSWDRIIKASYNDSGFDFANVYENEGEVWIAEKPLRPNSEYAVGLVCLVTNSESQIASVRTNVYILDISATVSENDGSGIAHCVSGIIRDSDSLSFDSPITPRVGQAILIHWSRYV